MNIDGKNQMLKVLQFPYSPLAALRQAEQVLIDRCASGASNKERAVLAEVQLSLAIAHADGHKDDELAVDETLIRIWEELDIISNNMACTLFQEAIARYYVRSRNKLLIHQRNKGE